MNEGKLTGTKFIVILLITGLVLGTYSISNNALALSEDTGKLVPTDKKSPPTSPPGLEKEGMVRIISSTTSEKEISDIRQKGCSVIHRLNHATSFFCPSEVVKTLDNVRPVKMYQPHDQDANSQTEADRVVNELGYDGSDIHVATLDTGAQTNHAELASSIYAVQDFTGEGGAHLDYVGHGTHVAGIITGDGIYSISGNLATGVAPEAKIHVGKVCHIYGCPEDAILAGIAWAKDIQQVDVINMSLGGGLSTAPNCDADGDLIVAAVNAAVASGIVMTISSGNDYSTTAVSYPACASGAIAVGAVDKFDQITGFSNKGPALDIVAPGNSILSSWSCKDVFAFPPLRCSSTWYNVISGTSMSSPHVAGVVALMLDKNPGLTVDQIKDGLYDTAITIGTGNFDGNGRVDAYAAVSSVLDGGGPYPDADEDGYAPNVDPNDNDPCVPDTNAAACLAITDNDGDGVFADVDTDDNDPCVPDTNAAACLAIQSAHVGDLNWQASDKKNWKTTVTITVDGDDHLPVSGVFVQADFNGDSVNCTTDDTGICQVTKTTKLSQLTFTVVGLSATGFESSNTHHDPEDDFPYGDPTVIILKGSSSGDSTPDPDPDPEPDPEPDPGPNCPPNSNKPACR